MVISRVKLLLCSLALALVGCAPTPLRGTGDLGLIIERASGHVTLVDTSRRAAYARIGGLGDLSHASVVYSRDARYAYVFGRDGGLSKLDLLGARLVKRVVQSGNAIGGSISQDGKIVVAQNYTPGGIKAFDADTLDLLAEVPAEYAPGAFSKVVGLADLSGQRFAYALFDGGEIWLSDFSQPRQPKTLRFPAGQQPYDGLVTPDGRHYLAGLFGEDGVAMLDTWQPELGTRRILEHYGRGEEKLPVFKMPHLRGWAVAQGKAYLPAIGRHEVLVVSTATWQEVGRIKLKGQPVFVIARPDGRQVWVNYAFPDNGWVEVIDTLTAQVVHTLAPGKAVLHMEFTPRGEHVWISARDDNRVVIYDTASFARIGEIAAEAPSGIFFTSRAGRTGF
ncbi:MAG TPA: cytochrome D1 domain-containing protein [Accumulibacter sp.]|uniref:cytochrome D1 domain-containing protein n=6 Tax=Accumulibacter sp. TaxID=2053492 RepID=UPI002C86E7CB|nr:cytochrome D1 domain-containing protein [Accumulibacter sp.]HMV04642.1 cytochrome D1 domain-containing protein [Accumulibacter sp.]HNB68496.1 cytochrome D1 domain-containing protein [Accumulibacter sp.]HNC27139.1 cytochrome D1 domain-containing protein [Accumulibacter sp.]HNG15367.1 cytochrome D1 domain-containing protein [Accumulibacter sp.]HNH92365.1 cytochrome D1 domain-containing protein [Accumulibacter sp.]